MRDQAAGLRALFARPASRVVPVIDNPAIAEADSLLDALVGAYLERGLRVLVVDAGARAPLYNELALLNLSACVERLSDQVSWLDARGLVAHHLDTRGSASGLLRRLRDAAPGVDLMLVRASAAELARVLAGESDLRPVLLADGQQQSLTSAYAGMKWLVERLGCQVFELLIAGQPEAQLTQRIARQLGETAERFLGVALGGWAALAPGSRPLVPNSAWRRVAHAGLRQVAA
jgi:flagellar biosynthesis protein FlhG